MKKSRFVLAIVLIIIIISGCFKQESEKKSVEYKVIKGTNATSLFADKDLDGVEIVLNGKVEEKDIVTSANLLRIVKNSENKTVLSIAGDIKKGSKIVEFIGMVEISSVEMVAATNGEKISKRSGEVLLGDFDLSGTVDLNDFVAFAKAYGTTLSQYDIAPAAAGTGVWADIYCSLTPDNKVDLNDFIIFAKNYGKKLPVVTNIALPKLTYMPPSLGPRIPGGVEAAKASEAPIGNKAIYVDAGALDGGNGSETKPFNSFESVNNLIRGGDYLYLTGEFVVDNSTTKIKRLILSSNANGLSRDKLTVIKSWPGKARAHFKGQNLYQGLIEFNNSAKNIRVANIEVSDSVGRGISFTGIEELVIIEDLYIHHTQGDTEQGSTYVTSYGVGGGVYAGIYANNAEFVVRNCLFEMNNLLYAPDANGIYTMIQTDRNNAGALSINSELYAADGSAKFTVYNNIFNNEGSGVRHKHPGNIQTEVYDNLFMNSARGIFIRSFKDNLIHHNVFYNLKESAVYEYNENTKGDLLASVYNNNLFNASLISNMPWPAATKATYKIYNNFCHNSENRVSIDLSPGNYTDVTFSKNIFLTQDPAKFILKTDGNTYYKIFDFSTFNAEQGNSNFRYDGISRFSTDVENHNAAYQQYLQNLKTGDVGAYIK